MVSFNFKRSVKTAGMIMPLIMLLSCAMGCRTTIWSSPMFHVAPPKGSELLESAIVEQEGVLFYYDIERRLKYDKQDHDCRLNGKPKKVRPSYDPIFYAKCGKCIVVDVANPGQALTPWQKQGDRYYFFVNSRDENYIIHAWSRLRLVVVENDSHCIWASTPFEVPRGFDLTEASITMRERKVVITWGGGVIYDGYVEKSNY